MSFCPEDITQTFQDIDADRSQVLQLRLAEVGHVMATHGHILAELLHSHVHLLAVTFAATGQQVVFTEAAAA